MNVVKPRTIPGVMELLPREQAAFDRMLAIIRRTYQRFGFLPIETPVMELSEILLTKSGGETERQIYLAQSSGARAQGREPELTLRFDLTVPLARYVAEYERQLVFPFRRFQIQRVYRGESAQRGRFREFYQCDIDVVGKDRLNHYYDAEIPVVIYQLFRDLDVGKFTIQISNRKLLMGLLASLGETEPERTKLIFREVDKLDKRGRDYVEKELLGSNLALAPAVVRSIMAFIGMKAESSSRYLEKLKALGVDDDGFRAGLSELELVFQTMIAAGVPQTHFAFNPSIARGLDYYTGTIYETLLDDHPEIGSVCSGGRYENLASHYTKSRLPGVGISIGATRLFFQLRAAGLIDVSSNPVQVLVTQMDDNLMSDYIEIGTQLRRNGLNTEIHFQGLKFPKQLKYADRAGIRFAVIMGPDEAKKGTVMVKDLSLGEQVEVGRESLSDVLLKRLAVSNNR